MSQSTKADPPELRARVPGDELGQKIADDSVMVWGSRIIGLTECTGYPTDSAGWNTKRYSTYIKASYPGDAKARREALQHLLPPYLTAAARAWAADSVSEACVDAIFEDSVCQRPSVNSVPTGSLSISPVGDRSRSFVQPRLVANLAPAATKMRLRASAAFA